MKRFKVISLHATNVCDLNCPFCYKQKGNIKPDTKLLYGLPRYLKQITNQCAVGGGEVMLFPEFVKKFGRLCKKNDLILNITSNGRALNKFSDKQLKEVLKDVTMISLSFDNFKIKTAEDFKNYVLLVKRIKKLTKTQVGCNLLVNQNYFNNKGLNLIKLVDMLFKIGCNRIFALCPKNIPCPDILKYKDIYSYLTYKYKMFFVDDTTKMVLTNGYANWKTACHYGKDLISISEDGNVYGCSFDCEAKSVLKIKNPKDILGILKIEFGNRFFCPYLKIPKVLNIP